MFRYSSKKPQGLYLKQNLWGERKGSWRGREKEEEERILDLEGAFSINLAKICPNARIFFPVFLSDIHLLSSYIYL